MKDTTRQLIAALAEIRGRLSNNENMTRDEIARAHRMARKGYRGENQGREWTASVRRNFELMVA